MRADAILSLAVDRQHSGTVYAGTSAGMFKTIDSGATWSAVQTRSVDDAHGPLVIPSVAIDPLRPETVYAAGTYHGILKTTDAGANWTTVNSDLSVTSPEGRMVLRINPQATGTVYAGTDGGLFKTMDAGANWSPMNAGLPSDLNGHLTISALEPDPRDSRHRIRSLSGYLR